MRGGFVTVLALTAALGAVVAEAPQGRAEEPMTKTQADTIIDELRKMRGLLERLTSGQFATAPAVRPADDRAKVSLGTTPALGRSDAPMAIVEFTDYQCSFCQRFHMTAFDDLKREYIDTGKIRYVSRDLPLPMHPNAMAAAHAARCAGDQNKFWEMRHGLIVNANQLGPDRYKTLAEELTLDRAEFQACLSKEKYTEQIRKDMADAGLAGISGTPSFVVGRVTGDSVDGVRIVGAQSYAAFDAKLKELLGTR
ncbi:MAG: hypothetical protein DMD98_19935 [Candidatus Rokuibacteriota bacterium]|nr:MAG: hypothetical protein DMD98_19935 [Candidatus Rokubacteria bacterium]